MSMAFGLEYAMEYLREKNGWEPNQCGVQYDLQPPAEAGDFYVALDDGGIEAGTDATPSLKEILNINVGIWRKPEHLAQRDQTGNLSLPLDNYVLGAYTLHDLERRVVVYNSDQKKYGFHHNWELMNGLNSRYKLPDTDNGGTFCTPLFYRGRGKMEFIGTEVSGPSETSDTQPWYGYRLRFRGLLREQRVANSAYALG
jgi:hypothetical protein